MTKLFTIDTNILIYAADTVDTGKKQISETLLAQMANRRSILPLQCLNELYNAMTKKGLLPAREAQFLVEDALHSFRIVPTQPQDMAMAMTLHQAHKVQFYDALLWMTARRAGCTIFLTEDGQFDRDFNGITLHNPFAPGFDLDRLLG